MTFNATGYRKAWVSWWERLAGFCQDNVLQPHVQCAPLELVIWPMQVPERLLMGPGPANAQPRVLAGAI